ncbi:MAG: NAD(P)-dependent glycerol-3-phosphate dehydrogenase [Rickettsiales bacterium]|nr:NAD(P)-dependent glycerol-3-phosphate dehydrogenase [Rickettsiales bacterium]
MKNIGVIGGGAWGTALAASAVRSGAMTLLWAREEEVVSAINTKNENTMFLPGITLPSGVSATSDLNDMRSCDVLLLVVPSQFVRLICEQLASLDLSKDVPIVICSKGIENSSCKLMSEVIEDVLPGHTLAVISGPTFASEVANDEPTALSLSCTNSDVGTKLIDRLTNDNFKLVFNNDIIGSQIGGSVKNVLAIGCGMVSGLGKGDNTNAAIITLGLAEMGRLSQAKGGQESTNLELCCVGDLVLTCSSMQSRNMSLGFQLGQGKTLQDILNERSTVAEGVATSKSVYHLSQELKIHMPICEQVYHILHDNAQPERLIDSMLNI